MTETEKETFINNEMNKRDAKEYRFFKRTLERGGEYSMRRIQSLLDDREYYSDCLTDEDLTNTDIEYYSGRLHAINKMLALAGL